MMQRLVTGWLTAVVLLLGVSVSPTTAAESGRKFLGTWKVNVTLSSRGSARNLTVGIIQVKQSDGKPKVVFVTGGPPTFQDAKLKNVHVTDELLSFDIATSRTAFHVEAYPPKDVERPKIIPASFQINSQMEVAHLEKTLAKELAPADIVKDAKGFEVLRKARETKDPKEAASVLMEPIKEKADQPVAFFAAKQLLELREKADAEADVLKEAAELWIQIASGYGPAMQQHVRLEVSRMLLLSEHGQKAALVYARAANEKLPKDATVSQQMPVLKQFRDALAKNDPRNAELKALNTRIEKIETELDEEYLKDAIPFETTKYKGRKGESKRTVVLELFTGAQCPPCVSADIAFDALIKTYKPSEVVLLQYHLHIPGPDPLTNPASESRKEYYGDDLRGTPTMFLNGKVTKGMGGFRQHAEARYETLKEILDEALETKTKTTLKLDVQRKADDLVLKANVSGADEVGDTVRLRMVLIEDVVRYPGNNGIRLHHHVVRAFPGGVEGKAIKDKKAEVSASISLLELTRDLQDYLTKANENRPFLDNDRPLLLENLKAVAFLQDDDGKAIYQAVQVSVPTK